jgi:hypothetical protein
MSGSKDGTDAAFGEQLFDVAITQTESQVPPRGQHDHLGGKSEASESGTWRQRRATPSGQSHRPILPGS